MTTFSVLTAVYRPEPDHLAACLRSVGRQLGPGDEHVVVDDASGDAAVDALLDAVDGRAGARVVRRSENGGIVDASQQALEHAVGEWVVLLDHDDVLAADALSTLRRHVADHPDDVVVYSDHDVIRPDGRLADPAFKPDFSPDRLRRTNYITHLVAARADAVRAVGGFRTGTDGAQDHDLLLRLMEAGHRFGHVPQILAHWRQSPRSVASDVANKPDAFERGLEVVRAHVGRCGIDAVVSHGPYVGTYRIDRRADPGTLVSVVIPTRGSRGDVWGRRRTFVIDAVRSIAERSTHRTLEFVVVADADTPPDVVAALDRVVAAHPTIELRIVPFDEPFNFSRKVNQGVAAAQGDALLILNDDTELVEPGSIGAMLGLLGPDPAPIEPVGAVGARLWYPDGTLQHGGHVYHGEFMHACIGWDGEHPGPQRMFAIERECAGVTAAASMTTRAAFDIAGGFPEDLPLHFNDVAFSVRLRRDGHRILWTPHATWFHFEGRSRDRGASIEEWRRAAAAWPDGMPHDPYANPNLVPKRADWLELPGRSGAPPYVIDDQGVKRWG